LAKFPVNYRGPISLPEHTEHTAPLARDLPGNVDRFAHRPLRRHRGVADDSAGCPTGRGLVDPAFVSALLAAIATGRIRLGVNPEAF
jgi:hypothetical protein